MSGNPASFTTVTVDDRPFAYFRELLEQCNGGPKKYGGITDLSELKENLRQHCIPEGIFDRLAEDYDAFLEERRKLMATRTRECLEQL